MIHFLKKANFAQVAVTILVACIGIVLSSCSSGTALPQATKPVLITMSPDATLTPTPFQPESVGFSTPGIGGSATVQPDFGTWGNFPAPQIYPAYIQIPPPAILLPRPPGQIYILLLGSDQRPNDTGFRTDTMILITLNPQGKVSLTSFPRDLYVYIPGWTVQRLNTAQGYGGFNSTALTFEYNFGIHPDYYVLINFDGFRSVVKSLGGISVNVAQNFFDSRTGYPNGFNVNAGTVQMDGETALWYVRSRHTSNDIDRLRRAQEVIQAIGQKLLTLNGLSHVPELYNSYHSNVDTNLTLEATLKLLPAINLIKNSASISRFVIGYDQAYDWVDPGTGAQVLIPIPEKIQSIIQQAVTFP